MEAVNYSRNERKMPYTGATDDNFSKWMYSYRHTSNIGFTCINCDWIIRNYSPEKRTIGLIELKTYNAALTYAEQKTFEEFSEIFKAGCLATYEKLGFRFIGFFELVFSGTCWNDSTTVTLNGYEITETQFLQFLNNNF